jgi:sortase A
MMTLALAPVVVTVVSITLRGDPKQAVASVTEATTAAASVEPLIRGESPYEPWVEKAIPLPTAEVAKNEPDPEASASKPKPESGPAPEAKPKSQSQSPPTPEPQARPEPEPQAQPEPEQQTLPAGDSGWSRPTDEELEAASEPRHYGNLPAGAIMGLTVPGMGIYDAPVFDSASQWALTNGVAHVPDTSLPRSRTPDRNVYLAGHRMGYSGTWSRMIFYHLNKLGEGDEVLLEDREGGRYEYRVIESFVVDPDDNWVMGRVRGRDMLTLQTCTPIPGFDKRLIVRAERI